MASVAVVNRRSVASGMAKRINLDLPRGPVTGRRGRWAQRVTDTAKTRRTVGRGQGFNVCGDARAILRRAEDAGSENEMRSLGKENLAGEPGGASAADQLRGFAMRTELDPSFE